MIDPAQSAFEEAQRVYRADHDHFPMTHTWATTSETVRNGWQQVADAVIAAYSAAQQKMPETGEPMEVLRCEDCRWSGDPLEAFIDDNHPTKERCPKCGSFDTYRDKTAKPQPPETGGLVERSRAESLRMGLLADARQWPTSQLLSDTADAIERLERERDEARETLSAERAALVDCRALVGPLNAENETLTAQLATIRAETVAECAKVADVEADKHANIESQAEAQGHVLVADAETEKKHVAQRVAAAIRALSPGAAPLTKGAKDV